MTTDPRGMVPEFYDALLALLLQARENTCAEGFLLAVQVFEDAATVAASLAEDLRKLGDEKIVIVPGERTVAEVFAELDSWENMGLSHEEALAQVFSAEGPFQGIYRVSSEQFRSACMRAHESV